MGLALVVTGQGRRSLSASHVTVQALTREHAEHAAGQEPSGVLKSHVFRVKAADVTTANSVNGAVVAVSSSQPPKQHVKGAREQVHFRLHVENVVGVENLNPHVANAVDRDGIAFNSALKLRKDYFVYKVLDAFNGENNLTII